MTLVTVIGAVVFLGLAVFVGRHLHQLRSGRYADPEGTRKVRWRPGNGNHGPQVMQSTRTWFGAAGGGKMTA